MDDPCYRIGGGVPQINIKILCVVSQEAHKIQVVQVTSGIYKWCHSSNQVMSIKNARFKPQPSTPKCIPNTFASMRSTPFMEIDDKGGEIVQRYESFEIKIVQGGEIRYESFGRD